MSEPKPRPWMTYRGARKRIAKEIGLRWRDLPLQRVKVTRLQTAFVKVFPK